MESCISNLPQKFSRSEEVFNDNLARRDEQISERFKTRDEKMEDEWKLIHGSPRKVIRRQARQTLVPYPSQAPPGHRSRAKESLGLPYEVDTTSQFEEEEFVWEGNPFWDLLSDETKQMCKISELFEYNYQVKCAVHGAGPQHNIGNCRKSGTRDAARSGLHKTHFHTWRSTDPPRQESRMTRSNDVQKVTKCFIRRGRLLDPLAEKEGEVSGHLAIRGDPQQFWFPATCGSALIS